MLARSNGPARRGTALLVTMGLVMVTSLMLAAMVTLSSSRNRSAFAADSRLARNYAADAGLERAKLEVAGDKTWLATNAPTAHGNATFTGGTNFFNINGYKVTVRVYTMTDPAWYRVESTAISTSLKGPSTTLGMTFKNAATITTTATETTKTVSYTLFSDYARFVSLNNLSVGANASYKGKVHTNGNLSIDGNNVTFYDNATCHGSITYQDSTAKSTCTFKKSATPGVPPLDFPSADKIGRAHV
jgi:Tfp pilus assembly protein PilX